MKSYKTTLYGVTILLMNFSEIDAVNLLKLNGLLKFSDVEELHRDTNDYHEGHIGKVVRQLQKDCDAGYKQINRRVWVAVS